ncbi:hypothetical protein NDU88_007433 [Pleurodeles waltl]|uniref:Uncharacterized protein n=1 Tax=Pleurodeles waltl TaxID=8319 RepID=A0AAV7VUF7_PLEWA|nr:hypothetical protein NDU88_007433 [Pleurodeles waltl]
MSELRSSKGSCSVLALYRQQRGTLASHLALGLRERPTEPWSWMSVSCVEGTISDTLKTYPVGTSPPASQSPLPSSSLWGAAFSGRTLCIEAPMAHCRLGVTGIPICPLTFVNRPGAHRRTSELQRQKRSPPAPLHVSRKRNETTGAAVV